MTVLIYLEIMILFFVCCIPFFIEKHFRFHSPTQFLSIIICSSFGIPTIYILNNMKLFTAPYLREDSMAKSILFVILVYAFLLLGFYLSKYDSNLNSLIKRVTSKAPNINDYNIKFKNFPFVVVVFETIGWLSRLIIIKLGLYLHIEAGYSALKISGLYLYGQYLYIFTLLPTCILLITFIKCFEKGKNRSNLILSLILLVLESAYYLPTGSKEKILMPILFILIILSLKGKLNSFILLGVTLFSLLFIFPFTNIFKLISNGRIFDNFIEALQIYFQSLFMGGTLFSDEILYYVFGVRLNYTDVLTNIIVNTPRIWEFKLGWTYLTFFTAFIPRFIWADKPMPGAIGIEFANDYGYNQSFGDLTSVTTTRIGELFINFGWFGIIGAFFIGILYFTIYTYFLNRKRISELCAIFYCYAFFSIVNLEGPLCSDLSGVLKIYFFLLLFLFPFIKKIKQ